MVQICTIRVGPEILTSILDNRTRFKHSWILLLRNPDERVRFVILQENVVLRPILLDERVLKYEGFYFCISDNEIKVLNLAYQHSRLCINRAVLLKVGSNPTSQVLSLSNIYDASLRVLMQINARSGWQRAKLLLYMC